ncbi:D-alanyl-D-alanine carboxypeptidase family protein [Cytobacillus sp. Hz8]|uniref:D-alanyl-D-alanine carboxypeptidase family protein n=1 Tax=Cytobacillus sp. Hz8 TaxID=3347168 RepID=UPI0035DD9C31
MLTKSKLFLLFLAISCVFEIIPQKAQASVSVSAKSAILIEQDSGRIIFEKNANEKRRIASITKIMTAILAIESDKLDKTVTVSENAVWAEGSSIYLKPHEKIKLSDLVYGMMLRSGNDAAVAIAENVGGSVDGFVYLMNQKAEEIGMKNTHFANPHGLDDHEDHYSTAYDMALLTRYAMNNPTYRSISGTKVHRAPNPEEKWDRVWKNKNRLLTELYEYCTGGKTGYTKRAKRTLVTTAEKGDMKLIAVTLNDSNDWNDHILMYESAFKQYDMAEVLEKGTIDDLKNSYYRGKTYVNHSVTYPITNEEKDLFRIEYKMLKPQKNWKHSENIPEIVGRATIYFNQQPIKKLPIYYRQKKEKDQTSLGEFFKIIITTMVGVREYG